MWLYLIQLEWIKQLQSVLRTPFTDALFMFLNYFDSLGFSLLLIITVSYLVDRKIGFRLFYILILSSFFANFFKNIFQLPRPCQMVPSLGLLCDSSYGLPSGGAMLATILFGVVWTETKNPIFRSFTVFFSLLLCFSRIYLGVHFITDVLGGIVLGTLLVLVYRYIFPPLEKRKRWTTFLLPFFMALFNKMFFFGVSIGVAIGLLLGKERVCQLRENRFTTWLAVLILAIILDVFTLLYPAFMLPLSLMLGLWFTLGPPRIACFK